MRDDKKERVESDNRWRERGEKGDKGKEKERRDEEKKREEVGERKRQKKGRVVVSTFQSLG